MATNAYYKKYKGCTVLEYLDPEDIEKDGLLNNEIGYPNATHPSDHFSLGYKV